MSVEKKVTNISKKPAVHHSRFKGEVSAVKPKTITVKVRSVKSHQKYHKQFFQIKKFATHDEKNLAKKGDQVLIEECRPLSKTKRWRLIEVLKSKS